MIENIEISIPVEEVEDSPVGEYLQLSDLPGEFLLIRRMDDSLFYFLCTSDCPIQEVCHSFDWYIVSNDKFNEKMIIGAGLAGNDNTEGIIYRVRDEDTLKLWKDILLFTFESDFIKQFFPYTNHFKGKMRIDDALCFYIHDYYPVSRHKDISTYQKKVSNLVFRFKEGKQSALVAKLFSLAIMRMPFFKELRNPVLISIPAATRERNIRRFAQFNYLLSKRIKVEDGFRAIWIKEDREQLKGTKGHDKLVNLVFHPEYYTGKDVLLVDDIFTTGDSFIQVKRELVKSGARSVTGLFFGKTIGKE
ncbi:ribonucleotide-diphosphate reductase subunit beta [Dysgonomonas sp. 216]|uniref:ribonucleotide-diphosphate reductase subunit beta n=1 Tax=Dysgonomonas sp. 216 TaxID=2302934 RepID=UPI0013D1E1B7|nr:ribonucleotide-diphosphate reductase subunit beta [Dysgonomonas sp. 216]NDW18788.1 ribonucleotide-diphosphate reductase subunit beta [Dysgonomonas sp. 216]